MFYALDFNDFAFSDADSVPIPSTSCTTPWTPTPTVPAFHERGSLCQTAKICGGSQSEAVRWASELAFAPSVPPLGWQ